MRTVSGVYEIRDLVNAKVYIGSSANVYRRWRRHRQALRKGSHFNIHLLRAFQGYGASAFTWNILEEISPDKALLIAAEQKWLDKTECYKSDKGYNIRRVAESCLGYRWSEESRSRLGKEFIVTSPIGEAFRIRNLRKFCEERGLVQQHMRLVAMGEWSQYRGWTCVFTDVGRRHIAEALRDEKSRRARYIITDPEGNVFRAWTLKEFCFQRGLDRGYMGSVARGKWRNYRGWRCDYIDPDKRWMADALRREKASRELYTIYLVTDPNGKHYRVTRLSTFCEERGLNHQCMRKVAKGQTKKHRGWVCEYDAEEKIH